MIRSPLFALLAALCLAGCAEQKDPGALDVSVIGATPRVVDPNRRPLAAGDRLLMAAVAQGLVAFDGSGQIEPGLASRWDVSDDGLYFTFRLDRDRAPEGAVVAKRLKAVLAQRSRNSLKPLLGVVAEIVAVTPQVVEIRLSAPRPNFLQLLAQPELALLLPGEQTKGPFVVALRDGDTIMLRRAANETETEDEGPGAGDREYIRLRGERAASAVARFRSGATSLVLGGTFADLVVARAANPRTAQLRLDPASGLFGLQIAKLTPFLREAANRRALAMAVDRDRITRAFDAPGWLGAAATTPSALEGLPTPARADWIVASPDARRTLARRAIAEWTALNGTPQISVALPEGPGSRLLLALLQAEWGAVGVTVVRAPPAEADLRLLDEVAPADLASWYLRHFTCDRSVVCSPQADAALDAALTATTLPERNNALAAADRMLVELTPFIPIATPLRWSLVAPQLDAFRPNARAVHPLHHLRTRKD